MTGKLTKEEIKNLEELIESDDIDCVMLAREIVSTLNEELQLKYHQKIYCRMLYMWFKNSSHKVNITPQFLE